MVWVLRYSLHHGIHEKQAPGTRYRYAYECVFSCSFQVFFLHPTDTRDTWYRFCGHKTTKRWTIRILLMPYIAVKGEGNAWHAIIDVTWCDRYTYTYTYVYILCIYITMCKRVFLALWHFFLFRPRVFSRVLGSVVRREHARTPRWSLGPGLLPRHVLWGFKAASPPGKGFRARRAIQAHANTRGHSAIPQGQGLKKHELWGGRGPHRYTNQRFQLPPRLHFLDLTKGRYLRKNGAKG